jgi:hypothetical protein
MAMAHQPSDQDVDRKIRSNLNRLKKPGVLTVRPGYEIAGTQLTGKRAIVATVHTKKPLAALDSGETLPEKLGGLPVDVREASPHQRLRAVDPLAASVSQTYASPDEAEPEWPLEREMPSGKLLASPTSHTQQTLAKQSKVRPASNKALSAHSKKPNVPYEPGGCPPLVATDVKADVTVAISPDAGYATLSGFLQKTSSSLTVGMYDFTSGPLLTDFEKDLGGTKKLQLVLDSPSLNDTADQSDWQTAQSLTNSLKGNAHIARALTRSDHFAEKWSFPSAYHIKVIVQDSGAFWLSSGNLNNSNEPAPDHTPHTEDRDWHVIINDKGLSGIFASYLNYDFKTAAANQAPDPNEIEKEIEEARNKKATETNPTGTKTYHSKKPPTPSRSAQSKTFAAKTFPGLQLTVTPLLTPDVLANGSGQYLTQVMALIGGAQKSIDIQLQYIEASKGDGSPYDRLLQALADKIAAGVDVRLIVSANYASKWGEKMKSVGVDLTANIRTQPNVHNKGFVVDQSHVIVSSQNFSPQGVTQNRDAGVILESAAIAGYFQPIFDNDWQGAIPFVAKGAAGTKPAAKKKAATKKAPAGKKKAAKKKKR